MERQLGIIRRGDESGGRAGRGGEDFFEENSFISGADGEDAPIESNGSVRGAKEFVRV